MEFDQVLAQRWSCRAFLDRPVAGDVLDRLFTLAQRTPSWCNTQPWHTHLLSHAATERLAKSLTDHVLSSPMSTDLEMPRGYSGVHDARRKEAGYALYASLGIERSDRPARDAQMLKNFSFFGAPHVAIITTDAEQATYGAVDCGGFVTNLLGAAHNLGLGAIAQAAIAMYADHVREFLDLPDDRLVLCAVSIGHPDPDHPVNRFRTSRAGPDEAVTLVE